MALKIDCPEHFAEVAAFAKANGAEEQFTDRLERLQSYGEGTTCHLYQDFAPLSFIFMVEDADKRRVLTGGLIYRGPTQPLDGSSPAFTVSIGPPTQTHSWSIHT